MIISVPVQTDVYNDLGVGASVMLVALQVPSGQLGVGVCDWLVAAAQASATTICAILLSRQFIWAGLIHAKTR